MDKRKKNIVRGVPLKECLTIPSHVGCFVPDSNFRKSIDIRTWGQV